MPKLLHFILDPFSRRTRLALAEYGVSFELIDEQPWQLSDEIFALNPEGTLPVFFDENQEVICGIQALSEYLEETRGKLNPLIPGSMLERAEIRRLVGWYDIKFYQEVSAPIIEEKLIKRFTPFDAGGGSPDMRRVRQALKYLRDHLHLVGHLAETRSWLGGSSLTIADLSAAAHISVIDYLGDVPWAEYPAAMNWYQRIKSRPSFRPLLADLLRGVTPSQSYSDLDF